MMSRIGEIALEFCGRGGKRLRPRLCRAAFKTAGTGRPPCKCGRIEDVCEAVECFHKASLIHDDIQDCDEERYGRPTVWKEHGVALAIAAGDWLVAHGYDLIVNSGFPNVQAMMAATVRSHIALCEGQGDDLLVAASPAVAPCRFEADYLSVCERKTGEAFALAAELGALAAGADGAPYRRYGLDFGVLFQVRDDIADGDAPEGADALAERLGQDLASSPIAAALGAWC
jgi:geranylgeranyl pyrophosphate synthase